MPGTDQQLPNLPDWLLDLWDDFLDLRSALLASGSLSLKEKNLLRDVHSENCKTVFLGFLDQRLKENVAGCTTGSSAEDELDPDAMDGDDGKEVDRNEQLERRAQRTAVEKGGDDVCGASHIQKQRRSTKLMSSS